MKDEEFLAAFEACTLPASEFTYAAHVRAAHLYLQRGNVRAADRSNLGDDTPVRRVARRAREISRDHHRGVAMTYINSAPAIGKITHRPGRHCASSAIRDLIEFHGTNLTEAACFGIGAGLGITYLELPEAPVPFMTHVRSLGYEKRAFENMGVPFVWSTYRSPNEATLALDELLDAGRPALLLTDSADVRKPHAFSRPRHHGLATDSLSSDRAGHRYRQTASSTC